MTEFVEGDAVGDLVQPGARVLILLERPVGAIGLDERVLGEVGGEVGVAAGQAEERAVDLAVGDLDQALAYSSGGLRRWLLRWVALRLRLTARLLA